MATKKTTTKKTPTKKTVRKTTKKELVESETITAADINSSENKSSKLTRPSKQALIPLIIILGVLALLGFGAKYFVVAWVDKKPITRWEFYQALEQRYGKDMKEQLIAEKLILNEAQKRGINVSQKEITDEIAKIESQRGGAEQLDQLLQVQGLSREDLNKLVKLQLLEQKMFTEGTNISDAQVEEYIAQNQPESTNGAELEITAEQKEQIKDQLRQQAVGASFSAWLQQNLESNRVQRN